MTPEKTIIKSYNIDNADEYQQTLSLYNLPAEFSYLPIQTFKQGKTIFLMFLEKEYSFWWFKYKKETIIGYCITQNANELTPSCREYIEDIYSISQSIAIQYPLIISDFMIANEFRRNGYGHKFATHLIDKIYLNQNISLYAKGDGVYFWPKLGFNKVDNTTSILIKSNIPK